MVLLLVALRQVAELESSAPVGTGLEWMTVGSVVIPAVLLIFLIYAGIQQTV